jgi:eukaryotic-like serine/threonine-protein kinase
MRTIGQGRYTLVQTIHHDGNGLLWAARDNDNGQDLIVKELIPPDGLYGQELKIHSQQVFRAARIARRLSSPTLAKVYNALNEDGTIYVVSEQVKAPRLNDVVEHSGQQSEAWVTLIADQLLAALEVAQDANITVSRRSGSRSSTRTRRW